MMTHSGAKLIRIIMIVWSVTLLLVTTSVQAQDELAATLEVLSPGVQVQRVNTVNWIDVRVEAIVGVGDRIRTDATGRALITFFTDGTETELEPSTEMIIQAFSGNESQFTISIEVLIGQTIQQLNRLLDPASRYEVITPGMNLGARGTQFAIRVEPDGRSAMLVREGEVEAANEDASAAVPSGFGVRAPEDGALSDVVRASSFEELDAALDGCTAVLTTPDDVSLNVRLAPNIDAPRVGVISASDVNILIGKTESSGWYRIQYRGGFGWILSSTALVDETCVGLREFPDDQGAEDPTLYESLGDDVTLDSLLEFAGQPSPEATTSP